MNKELEKFLDLIWNIGVGTSIILSILKVLNIIFCSWFTTFLPFLISIIICVLFFIQGGIITHYKSKKGEKHE